MAAKKASELEATRRWKAAHRDRVRFLSNKYHVKRRRLLDSLKAEPCKDCGGTFPPECMDFDHVKGEKIKIVGVLVHASLERIMAEIAKCELVCANCHRIRTKARSLGGTP